MCKFLLVIYCRPKYGPLVPYSTSSICETDLEIWVRGRSRSLEMAPIDRSYTTLYWSAIVSIALSCTIFEMFDVQNIVTLKTRLGVIEGHLKWHHSVDRIRVPIRLSL